jgi:hypothetical protein
MFSEHFLNESHVQLSLCCNHSSSVSQNAPAMSSQMDGGEQEENDHSWRVSRHKICLESPICSSHRVESRQRGTQVDDRDRYFEPMAAEDRVIVRRSFEEKRMRGWELYLSSPSPEDTR